MKNVIIKLEGRTDSQNTPPPIIIKQLNVVCATPDLNLNGLFGVPKKLGISCVK